MYINYSAYFFRYITNDLIYLNVAESIIITVVIYIYCYMNLFDVYLNNFIIFLFVFFNK
jgi:hypothetical protein